VEEFADALQRKFGPCLIEVTNAGDGCIHGAVYDGDALREGWPTLTISREPCGKFVAFDRAGAALSAGRDLARSLRHSEGNYGATVRWHHTRTVAPQRNCACAFVR
jgi:hypothetical protein